MYPEPKFLSEKDVTDFRKDTCVFCDSKFNTKKVSESIVKERRGSHYSEHYVGILCKKYLISDLDIYVFDFKFNEDGGNYLKLKQKDLVEKIKKEKEKEAPGLQKRLESKFSKVDLPEEQKKIAVDAIVSDYLSELNPVDFGNKITPLEERIGELFYNLRLGDLNLVCPEERWGGDVIEESDNFNIDCVEIYFDPVGLKSHKKCWPFVPFDNSLSFPLKFGKFFEHIRKNPRFEDYESLFRDFPNLLDSVKKLNITINSKIYNQKD